MPRNVARYPARDEARADTNRDLKEGVFMRKPVTFYSDSVKLALPRQHVRAREADYGERDAAPELRPKGGG